MENKSKWKLITCIGISLLSFYLLLPTLWSLGHPANEGKQPSWMAKSAMKLGLDLRGGIHMVMGVDLDEVVKSQLAIYGRSLEKVADKENLKLKTSSESVSELIVKWDPSADKKKIEELITKDFKILDIVREEPSSFILRLQASQEEYIRTQALDQSIATIRNRIDEFGVSEPILARKGDSQILVQFPGEQEPERLKGLIGQTAKLNFQMMHECTKRTPDCVERQQADIEGKIKAAESAGKYTRETFKRLSEYRARINQDLKAGLPVDTEVAFEKKQDPNQLNKFNLTPYLLSTKDQLSGEYIENAYVSTQKGDGGIGADEPVVAFQMNAAGAPLFGELTSNNVGHYMAIVLDGMVRSAPVINSPITGGSGIITVGRASFDSSNTDARDLAIVLRAGALPAKIETQEERVIGPSIGEDAIVAGKNALILTSILIFIFMWVYYGVAGLLANFAVAVNIALIFGILGLMGATLTLPGIAGIVLTIGMAVDALIIIYERMREEIRLGRNRKQIIALGFEHAFATILDSNVTTAIGAFVLLQYGTGSIRGFALTLLVGILTNVIMATTFTRVFFDYFFTDSTQKLTMGLHAAELQELQEIKATR